MSETNNLNSKILFFDGECSFCETSVQFVLNHSKNKDIYFAPLQGRTFSDINKSDGQLHLSELLGPAGTLVYLRKNIFLQRSNAAIWLAWDMGGIWKFAIIALLIPRMIRDWFYTFIAKRRKRIMNLQKNQTCLIPSAEQKKRLKD